MGIFNVDDEPGSSDESAKQTQSESDSQPNNYQHDPVNGSGRRRTRLIVVVVAIVVLAFVVAAAVTGVYVWRSRSSANASANSQTPKEVRTKLEAFQGKAGTVLVKSYSETGAVTGQYGGSVEVDAMELQDRSNGAREMGLLVNVKPSGQYAQESRSFIDYDEIDSLLKGIDYISNVTSATPPLKMFEAHYRTRGDFAIVTYSQADGKIGVAVTGSAIRSNDVFLSTQDLGTLRSRVLAAKETLDQLKK
ncbi:MAG TPA: hypothetical protein VLL54_01145 [Pyrinomonadaceae bacterium]|nr:hypothetical protein [Pyrinomonadaceae bacterium]